MYTKFLDKWGLTFDNMPDWSIGYNLLVEAYSQEFSATVNGMDALG